MTVIGEDHCVEHMLDFLLLGRFFESEYHWFVQQDSWEPMHITHQANQKVLHMANKLSGVSKEKSQANVHVISLFVSFFR